MSRRFWIKWESITHGWQMETNYCWDGTTHQEKFTFEQWVAKCKREGKNAGYKFIDFKEVT